ncbi:MAG: hypoxanthine phosphoribosyltransferase [Myxococcales bacterium]|nr:hypoxanthine phosphoribosyltransferase [Myxococcales bacterium]MCB9643068.1 hypoxanthine phosphoribosyltransferase [Myxococcales bacterium]
MLKDAPFETLLTEEQIQTRIRELGEQITQDYQDKDLVLVGVLRGSYLFLADLSRHIDLPLIVDFLAVSSYGTRTQSSGVVRLTNDLSMSIVDKDVLLVEDIVDTGLTMSYLIENLATRKPRSIKICSLLDKPARNIQPVNIDYLGFEIPDKFVVGYGLDYMGRYRNLPYIGYLNHPPAE